MSPAHATPACMLPKGFQHGEGWYCLVPTAHHHYSAAAALSPFGVAQGGH